VTEMLQSYSQYTFAADEIVPSNPTFFPYPALMTIWNKEILGNKVNSAIYPFEKVDNGRPMFFVWTENGFLIINLHAPNKAHYSAHDYTEIEKEIQKAFKTFCTYFTITPTPDKIIVTGDFNDRFGRLFRGSDGNIMDKGVLTLSENTGSEAGIVLHFKGKPPKSCCANWDSSCDTTKLREAYTTSWGDYVPPTRPTQPVPVPVPAHAQECKIEMPNSGTQYKLTGPGERHMLDDERADTKNYQYYGDYCFALNPETPLQIFRPDSTTTSTTQSDHELVYMTIKLSTSVGGRRTRRKRRLKRARYSKKRKPKRRST